MSAKKMNVTENVSTTTSAAATPSVLDLLRRQLSEAEESCKGSEKLQEELDRAKHVVTLMTEQLKPYQEARNRVSNIRQAIKSLEAPTNRSNHGVTMTQAVKDKLSASHKKLWAAKRAAAAGQAAVQA